MKKLFIIGNGFDRAHELPTAYNPHFKEIAEEIEQISYFWDIYQSREVDIWADFENVYPIPISIYWKKFLMVMLQIICLIMKEIETRLSPRLILMGDCLKHYIYL